jgi:Na+-translocating ferredoxin:NAD+ oxidoreductase subunit C
MLTETTIATTGTRTLWPLRGGLHLPDNKAQSAATPIRPAALPKRLLVPLQQHIGNPAKPLPAVGTRVLKGQLIAAAVGGLSAPVHAPTSGTLVAIEALPIPHPSGLSAPCLVIEPDGLEEWAELPPPLDPEQTSPEALRERIRDAGIVGMGGATFPTAVKLSPPGGKRIHTLVINGVECEPYITCDDRLMRERAGQVVQGIRIMQRLLGAEQVLIGIEDNKPEAAAAMRAALPAGATDLEVVTIPTRYPSGGERQLIYILTGLEVPSGSLPAQIGVVCHNVGTAAKVADAVLLGRPFISRVITFTGNGIAQPGNLEVLIGTPIEELIPQVGGYTPQVARLTLGGPMMGFNVGSDAIPVTKGINCVLATDAREAPNPGTALACIRCGRCAQACPMSLLPQQMYWHARALELDKAQSYDLFDCIECGCCSHVCPSRIPLVQYFRFAKGEVRSQDAERRKTELAKQRHEARTGRLERAEAEKQAKLRQKKEALEKKPVAHPAARPGAAADAGEDPKKAAIAAAAKRAAEKKAKLAAEGVAPQNIDQLTPAQQQQIAQADARRAVLHEGAGETPQPTQTKADRQDP